MQNSNARISRRVYVALTFDELTRCRDVFNCHVEETVKNTFEMKVILAELGQFPSEEELNVCMRIHGGKINFNTFCRYMEYLKYKFISPEPRDIDTVRAFAALGGGLDRSGNVLTDYLRETCKHFDLRIDIDQMILDVDQDNSGSINFDEFKAMWDQSTEDAFALLNGTMSNGYERSQTPLMMLTSALSSSNGMMATLRDAAQEEYYNSESSEAIETRLRDFFFPDGRETSHGANGAVTKRLHGNSLSVGAADLPSHKTRRESNVYGLPPRGVTTIVAPTSSNVVAPSPQQVHIPPLTKLNGGGGHNVLSPKKVQLRR